MKYETKCFEKNRISTKNKLLLLKQINLTLYPGLKEIEKLSKQTGLPEKRIKNWFRKHTSQLKNNL